MRESRKIAAKPGVIAHEQNALIQRRGFWVLEAGSGRQSQMLNVAVLTTHRARRLYSLSFKFIQILGKASGLIDVNATDRRILRRSLPKLTLTDVPL